jgi:hypothetical protein
MKMKKQIKLCHFMLFNSTDKEIKNFAKVLAPLKDKINSSLDYDIEFLLTNQDVQLMDLKYILDYLTNLDEKYKDIRTQKIKELYSQTTPEKNATLTKGDKHE